jgi:hypothetical protein
MLGPAMLPNGSLVQIAPYQHVVVVMSIVLGLSVTQLLKGLALRSLISGVQVKL